MRVSQSGVCSYRRAAPFRSGAACASVEKTVFRLSCPCDASSAYIPRTLAMTVCQATSVSVIDELPHGRKPVTTYFCAMTTIGEEIDFRSVGEAAADVGVYGVSLYRRMKTRPAVS